MSLFDCFVAVLIIAAICAASLLIVWTLSAIEKVHEMHKWMQEDREKEE